MSETDYQRRLYSELNPAEQAIVEHALPREKIDRNNIVDLFADEYGEETIDEAFTALKQEHRLFRRGNKSEYVMIRRDMF
ncbi:MAG: hypothetical protein ABEN55_22115 [Bradymonadaceae bacterium]